jgi:amphi-Trp domain-containing protein
MRTNPMRAAKARRSATPEFTHAEHVSRQQAAERLVDVAYALTGGATLQLRTHGDHVNVPIADEVLLERTSTTDGDRVDVHIQLSWSGRRTPANPSNAGPPD